MRNEKNITNSSISFRDRFISALLIGGVIGILLGSAIKMFYAPIKTVPKEMRIAAEKKRNIYKEKTKDDSLKISENHPVMAYIKAYQEGKWESVIEQTQWIQDRLNYINKVSNGDQQKIQKEKEKIIKDIKERDINKNFLNKEGIDDQYIFIPEAKITIIGIDDKGPFTDKRIKEMVWLNVEYPKPSKALRNENQIPIKSLDCALSINSDGRIIKSSIIGNAKIDYSSIKLWYSTKGET